LITPTGVSKIMSDRTFISPPFASSKTVSWIHIGDTHITRSGEQNEIDLGRIVDEINAVYAAGGVDFVFVPGDIADDGSALAYENFRKHLDRLKLPWFGIVGDHDVHERSFANFQKFIAHDLYSSFSVGPYRFFRLNAFSDPRPDSFSVDKKQLDWLESELRNCSEQSDITAVLFLHCYPSDLKQGAERLAELLKKFPLLLVDMGHTHYNEISNDGRILYSATRSTGQIEEGPVGYSLTTLDEKSVSWHFVPLGSPWLVNITQPQDERLVTERTFNTGEGSSIEVHAKVWSPSPVTDVSAAIAGTQTTLHSVDGVFWTGKLDYTSLQHGIHGLRVVAKDETGKEFTSTVQLQIGDRPASVRKSIDQENAIGEWIERGILGTQLGPNKNGRKW
jgi:3',5'-cyclic-AMP phosphodiesterase